MDLQSKYKNTIQLEIVTNMSSIPTLKKGAIDFVIIHGVPTPCTL